MRNGPRSIKGSSVGNGRWWQRKEVGDSLRGEGRQAGQEAGQKAGRQGLGGSPDTECACWSRPLTSAPLTVQKQLGLFHKRRCASKTEDETGTGRGPPLPRLARNREIALDGAFITPERVQNQHIWPRCPQMFPAGQGSDHRGLLGPFPPGTLGSLHTPLQTTPALFPRKREITSACLFIPCLGTRSLKGPRWVGLGVGGPGPCSNPQRLAFLRDHSHYLSQNLPCTNEEANPKRGNSSLKIAW